MTVTTKLTSVFDEDAQALMSGELYPIYSHDSEPVIPKAIAKELLAIFCEQKLNRYYDCIRKAKGVAKYLGISHIHLGSLNVESIEKGVAYGYEYTPPLE